MIKFIRKVIIWPACLCCCVFPICPVCSVCLVLSSLLSFDLCSLVSSITLVIASVSAACLCFWFWRCRDLFRYTCKNLVARSKTRGWRASGRGEIRFVTCKDFFERDFEKRLLWSNLACLHVMCFVRMWEVTERHSRHTLRYHNN